MRLLGPFLARRRDDLARRRCSDYGCPVRLVRLAVPFTRTRTRLSRQRRHAHSPRSGACPGRPRPSPPSQEPTRWDADSGQTAWLLIRTADDVWESGQQGGARGVRGVQLAAVAALAATSPGGTSRRRRSSVTREFRCERQVEFGFDAPYVGVAAGAGNHSGVS